MNRGRLRRYAVRALAATALGVALIATAGGIAHADTITGPAPSVIGRVVPPPPPGAATTDESVWN